MESILQNVKSMIREKAWKTLSKCEWKGEIDIKCNSGKIVLQLLKKRSE